MMRQGRVHDGSMGSSRAGLSAETRARVAPIARGNPAPAGSQTEKPCAAESGPTLGGDRARDVCGRGSRADGRRRAWRRTFDRPRPDPRRTGTSMRGHAPTETATADAFLASSTRSTPALATTFTARALEEARVARAAGAARTAETRETWATAIFLVCVLVCTRMEGARGRSRRWIAIVVQGRSWSRIESEILPLISWVKPSRIIFLDQSERVVSPHWKPQKRRGKSKSTFHFLGCRRRRSRGNG